MDSTASSKTSAGGVIYKKEKTGKIKILLIKDNWNQWTFAKGFVEEDELYKETAIREMSEELGIKAKKLRLAGDLGKVEYDYVWDKEPVHKKVYYFLFEWKEAQEFHLQKKEGIQKVKWVALEKLGKEIGYKENSLGLVKNVIKKIKILKDK